MKTRITELFGIEHPIIQGGMGAGVSGWQLARAVARRGCLGVVAGTALDTLMVRRLQLGDPGGPLLGFLLGYTALFVALEHRPAIRFGIISRDQAAIAPVDLRQP